MSSAYTCRLLLAPFGTGPGQVDVNSDGEPLIVK
jgi:hypothetical protein